MVKITHMGKRAHHLHSFHSACPVVLVTVIFQYLFITNTNNSALMVKKKKTNSASSYLIK